MTAVALAAMSKRDLEALMASWGEPRFRAAQVFRAVQHESTVDPDAITTLPVALRTRLREHTGGPATTPIEAQHAHDGTIKYLFELRDGKRVESVLIPEGDRRTVCVSSQVGCPIRCVFCASGVEGLIRNLDTGEILSVFSNPAPITIACMFVLSAGLERTGVIDVMGKFFIRIAGTTELRVLLVLMTLGAVLSAFINNTPVVVVFLPIVLSLARSTDLKASRLLIPLSFASILGGTCTLTGTSTNLIIDGIAQQHGQTPFTMFELTKLGLVYAAVGFVYMIFIGRRLLPKHENHGTELDEPDGRDFLTQFSVEKESELIGKTLLETLLKEIPEARILEVRRRGVPLETPLDELEIRQGDRLLVTLHGTSFEGLKETEGIRFAAQKNLNLKTLETRPLKLMEGIVGARSSLIGKTLNTLRFRQRYGVHILAVHRQGVDLKKDFGDLRLAFGDTLLIEGPLSGINQLQGETDFVSLNEPRERTFLRGRLWLGTGIAAAFILGASFQVLSIPALAILAALAMIVSRCLSSKQAYLAVQWDIIFLIFGMLALGLAMQESGAARLMVDGVTGIFGTSSPYVLLAVVYLLCSTLTELISNNAVAALLTPIVIGIAASLDVDARPFIVAMMFGCSASFATPIGYQTNTYVYGAGGYRFSDFPKVGLPLNFILWLVATLLIPVFWPFVSP
ncbi:MAG: SLC13 family permease [Verrucomicrobiales bacterium]